MENYVSIVDRELRRCLNKARNELKLEKFFRWQAAQSFKAATKHPYPYLPYRENEK